MIRLTTTMTAIAFLTACSSAYYGALEKVGVHKREILVDRIAEAQESQTEASEQFESALAQFAATVNFDGGDLEDLYENLNDEFERSVSKAEDVSERIEDVRDVAGALFDEWEDELEQYSDDRLRRQSKRQLEQTQQRYARLIRAMERAESRLDPVLDKFRDQVLFLKHNLNARAIGSLKGELATIESDVASLVAAMNRSIDEAQAFINSMDEPEA